MIVGLLQFRNKLIQQGRYTDAVDELLSNHTIPSAYPQRMPQHRFVYCIITVVCCAYIIA